MSKTTESIFSPDEMLAMGFKELEGDVIDGEAGGYYKWWRYKKNESDLYITYEYSPDHKITAVTVEMGYQELKGRAITRSDIKLLMELM